MRGLTARELVEVWEQGAALTDHQRADLLLRLAAADLPRADALSVGERDALLLRLRELTYGPALAATARCPSCGERLELSLAGDDLRATAVTDEAVAARRDGPAVHDLSIDGYDVRVRAPTGADIDAVSAAGDVASARAGLLARCVVAASRDGAAVDAADLPEAVVVAIAERLGRADPQADVALAMTCPACALEWEACFDIARFFWEEIELRVPRLLDQVVILASAYGWREEDILGLGPRRRHFYLQKALE